MTSLVVDGGTPVWDGAWPAWPRVTDTLSASVDKALRSGRWAVSGEWTGEEPLDRRLADRFARYAGTDYCLPVDHGSSALVLGLLASEVRPGDEVIVPGMTWVATASAVARLGARPVLVDVDPGSMCLDPEAVADAITPRTRAVVAVHLYSAMADMDRLRALCVQHELGLIEDCAQAYGARWRGRPAGSWGDVGAFSTQQGKALTSGEGGLFVTSRPDLYELAEMYRGDGRRYAVPPPPLGRPALREYDRVQGWNMHLSELQAAVLLDALVDLVPLDERRRRAAELLDSRIAAESGEQVELVTPYPHNDARGYYHYVLRLKPGQWEGVDVRTVCAALSAELGLYAHITYPPLNAHPLYDPRRMASLGRVPTAALDPGQYALPVAEALSRRTVLVHHSALLADPPALEALVDAVVKVCRNRRTLRGRELS